jgi:hypothetical protein
MKASGGLEKKTEVSGKLHEPEVEASRKRLRYPLARASCGSQSLSKGFGEEIITLRLLGIEPRFNWKTTVSKKN